MKAISNLIKRSHKAWSPYSLPVKGLILSALIFTGIQTTIQAQQANDTLYTRPSWWFGVAGAGNVNFYRGSTQEINSELIVPAAFHDGKGVGLYLAPLVEYHKPDKMLGLMLQVGYDNRKGKFDQIISPCNCPEDLKANPSYITVEPSIRLAPFKGDFYLYAGPRVAFNMSKSFTYKQGVDPAYPDQIANPEVKGDFSNMNKNLLSMQIGAGYDIQLSSQNKRTQWALSPFISYQPYFGQDPRSIETWNVTTVRIGAALKFGHGKKIEVPVEVIAPLPVAVVIADPEFTFTVVSPTNIPVERRVRETFPIRNYVFFDLGSTKIPERYVLISKDQVKDFREDRLETFTPKRLSGRSDRQMTVYYNVINILGDRMGRNPEAVVRLTGASMEGKDDGLAMAESVKKYLVDVFAISPARINTEGRIKPRISSEQPGGTKELDLLREGDHRVSIWSESPAIMMEYQTGPDVPLKPVEISTVQEAPLDSYVTLNNKGADEAFTSWYVEVKDEKGVVQKFGPYKQESVSIPGKAILGTRPSGDYTVKMYGTTKNGNLLTKEAKVHMVLWTPSEREEGMRYSVIFEFNDSKAIGIYDKYLTEVVTPKIPKDGTVIIHGHTDTIGEEAHNQKLSLERANEVKGILESALAKAGRTDVKFEVYGFGEDAALAPFENNFPEERFYNRTVIIDLIPPKK
jgi:outer membrane protein OmpA-like peptidoglycan-associated protein